MKKRKLKWLWITLSVFGVLILGTGAYGYYMWDKTQKTVATIHEDIDSNLTEKAIKEDKVPISVLLMGVDERSGDRGRSDSLILLTVNPNKESTKMVSIQRDTRTEIIGNGTIEKINHAYARGGAQMTIDTVENFLDVPINYFVKVNMESFQEIVDAVGGINVYNDLQFSYGGYDFPVGDITLETGEEALAFTRMRKGDTRGDYGRMLRQREVIEGVIEKGANIASITKFDNILEVVENNIKTNLTFDEMWSIQSNYTAAIKNIDKQALEGTGKYIDGVSYQIVTDEDRNTLSQKLKEHLEISSDTAKNNE
ncbi:LCP family protein [Bacillus carboniphilus]|uniref:LCP family protein n=1 Tax=Bacillus carboniphilus TaxID=86663 RepID=A0ABY9JQ35_9BACI|nr:LCP family protein [Bacillus carboniphilus]WLR41511.1 LCP family protein [Bacillus carboniphilus]